MGLNLITVDFFQLNLMQKIEFQERKKRFSNEINYADRVFADRVFADRVFFSDQIHRGHFCKMSRHFGKSLKFPEKWAIFLIKKVEYPDRWAKFPDNKISRPIERIKQNRQDKMEKTKPKKCGIEKDWSVRSALKTNKRELVFGFDWNNWNLRIR